MAQKIFDTDNAEDMALLWSILPNNVVRIYLEQIECFELPRCMVDFSDKPKDFFATKYIAINWHNKTEITRPIQECTEQDIGKICVFYDRFDETDDEPDVYAVLHKIENQDKNTWFYTDTGSYYAHCRRLTKQEIEELC